MNPQINDRGHTDLPFFLLLIFCYLSFPYAIFMLGIAYLHTHEVYIHVICVLNKPTVKA